MKNKTTKILFSSIIAIAVIGSAFGYNEIIALDNEYQFDKSEQPHADSIAKMDDYETRNGESNFQKYSVISIADMDLKILGSEWELVSLDTVATTEPFEVTKLVALLRLVDSPENSQQCEFQTEATIIYDAKTDNVLEKIIPELGVCVKPLEISKRTETAFLPDFIPQAFASSNRAFLTSEQGSPSGYYGGFGYMYIPTLDETANPDSIFNEQDSQVSFTYNQMINTKFFQTGWYVSTAQKALVYADENTHGDWVPRGINGLTWLNNAYAVVYIQCGSLDDYFIKMYHNGELWSHDTNYDCDNTTDNDTANNSVFLENANTVATSEWSDEIETTVKAYSMQEYDTKTTYSNWDSASNTKEYCPSGNVYATTSISSSLGSGGTSVWTVSDIDAC